jgi:hypothetical protein
VVRELPRHKIKERQDKLTKKETRLGLLYSKGGFKMEDIRTLLE